MMTDNDPQLRAIWDFIKCVVPLGWNWQRVHKAVERGAITPEEYEQTTGEVYAPEKQGR